MTPFFNPGPNHPHVNAQRVFLGRRWRCSDRVEPARSSTVLPLHFFTTGARTCREVTLPPGAGGEARCQPAAPSDVEISGPRLRVTWHRRRGYCGPRPPAPYHRSRSTAPRPPTGWSSAACGATVQDALNGCQGGNWRRWGAHHRRHPARLRVGRREPRRSPESSTGTLRRTSWHRPLLRPLRQQTPDLGWAALFTIHAGVGQSKVLGGPETALLRRGAQDHRAGYEVERADELGADVAHLAESSLELGRSWSSGGCRVPRARCPWPAGLRASGGPGPPRSAAPSGVDRSTWTRPRPRPLPCPVASTPKAMTFAGPALPSNRPRPLDVHVNGKIVSSSHDDHVS